MDIHHRISNYDQHPCIDMDSARGCAYGTPDAIVSALQERMSQQPDGVLVLDGYHGVDFDRLKKQILDALPLSGFVWCEEARIPEDRLYPKIAPCLTSDRVFGSMSDHTIDDFYDPQNAEALIKKLREISGWKCIYGVGAGYITAGDLLIYADLNRWELQLRLRAGLDNWGAGNFDEDILTKYKRGYFLEWRVLDRHKFKMMPRLDYFIDANQPDHPKMMEALLLQESLQAFAARPFRLVPYFDEGIWGGKWMEQVCGLQPARHNFAWCFDGVPEENSLGIRKDGVEMEFPAMNLVQTHPVELLGERVYARYGAEFPIRFDFLDTMEGGNLSLQVHPLTRYISQHFHMPYTQDESYYILDAKDDACVYLGIKDGIQPEDFIDALHTAQITGKLDVDQYVNRFPVRKHDHILIPAGTVHCSGANTMVLEISATPYIFTFKLWDWGRLGLDGKPRPINIERGAPNIQYDRTTQWCRDNLVNSVVVVQNTPALKEEHTGLHALEPIETRRFWFCSPQSFHCSDSVHMLNLVEGEEAEVYSPENAFPPLIIHYAETFIVPAACKTYCIRPCGRSAGQTIAVIQASIR